MADAILSLCGIYAVHNTITGKSYIGQSMRLPNRQREHFVLLRRGKHYAVAMQQDFDCLSETCFEFKVLEFCAVDVLTEREQHWIDFFKEIGLYNIALTAGSPLGVVRSKETRAKISAATLGRIHSEETIAKMRISQSAIKDQKRATSINQFAVPGAKEKLSKAKMGTVTSHETKAKLSITSASMWQNKGFKERLSAIQKIAQGKRSDQASQKMTEKWADPIFREQMISSRLKKKM